MPAQKVKRFLPPQKNSVLCEEMLGIVLFVGFSKEQYLKTNIFAVVFACNILEPKC